MPLLSKLKKLNPFATPPKGIPKVPAVHNLQHYAAQFSTSLKDDVMNSPSLSLTSAPGDESPPFAPQPPKKYRKPINDDEVACSSYIKKTKDQQNMPASFFETCNNMASKKNGQSSVSSSINQTSSSSGQSSLGGSSSSKPVAQKPIDKRNGYGKNLELLPGCSIVPRTPVQKQTVPLKELRKDIKANKGKVCVGNVHTLLCIHHPSRKQENGGQSTSSGIPAPLDIQPGFLINCALDKTSVARKTTPPLGHETIDEVGVDAMTLIYHEETLKPENRRTIIVPPTTMPPTHGFLNDHEILVSLQKYKGTMIIPKTEETISVPKPTAPPPNNRSSF